MTINRTKAPESQKITSLSYPQHRTIELPGGSKIYAMPVRDHGVVKLSISRAAGSIVEDKPGQAKFALSLSLNGTALHDANQIQETFEYLGTVQTPVTTLFSSDMSLKATKECFSESYKWLLENFSQAIYPENETQTLKQVTIADIQRKKTTPRYWAYRDCVGMVFGENHVMNRFADEENIASLKSNDLSEYHRNFLISQGADIYLSGDYTDEMLETVSRSVETAFQKQRDKTSERGPLAVPAEQNLKKHPLSNTSQVSMFLMKQFADMNEIDFHRFGLLNLILGGFFGSRLMQEIREEKGLTYGIGSYIMKTPEGNAWCISGEMNSKNADLALGETKRILNSMKSHPPAGDELERAKRYYTGQLRSSFDGAFAMPEKLKSLKVRGYSTNHFDTAMDTIWNCTTQELCELADNYLDPESFKAVLAGDI